MRRTDEKHVRIVLRRRKPWVVLESQGQLFKLHVGHVDQVARGMRGGIVSFSAQSRKRMLELTARVDFQHCGFVCFVTLTYPDREGPPRLGDIERDRQTFQKRIHRAYPGCSAIWRREWKARASGKFAGMVFPHYHFLCFGLPFVHHSTLNGMWKEVLRFDGYLRTEIEGVESWRKAIFYVSKYMAKVKSAPKRRARRETLRRGDAHTARHRAGAEPVGGASCSLVNVTYLTASEKEKDCRIGRSWGVFNRACLPLAERELMCAKLGEWLDDAKDFARECWAGIERIQGYGHTLFLDNAHEHYRHICALQEDDPNQFNEDGEYDPVPF